MIEFGWPLVFLLLPLPIAAYYLLPQAKQNQSALKVPFFQQLNTANTQNSLALGGKRYLVTILLACIWLLLICSAAKPQIASKEIDVPVNARDLLLAVDISGSMKMADMKVDKNLLTRIKVVKYVVGEFVKKRQSDRLGLILFGTRAYLQAPLTFDRKTVNTLLQEAQLGFAGEKTAIGDAIGLAVKRLQQLSEDEKILILLTDGANTSGEIGPRQAADLAAQAGVKIYTVGVGADQLTQQVGMFGGFQRNINPSADLDESTLEYIASKTSGQYFRAKDPRELNKIYGIIDKLEANEQTPESYRNIRSLFYWPLSFALILSLLFTLARVSLLSSNKNQATEMNQTSPLNQKNGQRV